MKVILALAFTLSITLLQAQSTLLTHWESRSPMPAQRANMASASLQIGDTTWIYCFMGIDSAKACGSSIRLESFRYNTISDQWSSIADVPDTEGRIAASATGLNGKIYLIGGYKVYANCNEFTSPRVDIYDPATDTWSLGDSMITPVDDHVQAVWRDSIIITVSGWSQNTNTRKVQLYDTYLDTWSISNDIAGPGLFGMAGAIWGDTILYTDGVRISGNFTLINALWQGTIQNGDPHNIVWTNQGQHPGPKIYRGGGFSFANRIIFTGGTDNAYNIDGIGYNNQPSVESGRTWGYNLLTGLYEEYARNPDSAMDVRQIVQVDNNKFYVIGGMESGQTVTNKVSVFVVDSVITGLEKETPGGLNMEIGPNPIQLEDCLKIRLPQGTPMRLRVVDALGHQIADWQSEDGEMEFCPRDWGMVPGVYFLVGEGDAGRVVRRVVLW
jgi:hypothetical protein